MKKNLCGFPWERRVPQTTRDNSVQPPIKETQHIFALLCHNHTYLLLIVFNTLLKYSPLQKKETEYENKPTWLLLEKAGPSNDARQQREACYKRNTTSNGFVKS